VNALLDNTLQASKFGIIIGTEVKDENYFIYDVDINSFGEIFALALLRVPNVDPTTFPHSYSKSQIFMLFSPLGSLMKADYYDYSNTNANMLYRFNKARFIGSNRMQVAVYSIYADNDTPIAIYYIDKSTIT
jgi:hypothetical protein